MLLEYIMSSDPKKSRVMNGIKKYFLIFSLLLIYPVLATAQSDTNFVANPGFESGTTIPLNWTFVSINENTPIWSSIFHGGSKSVEISIPGTTDLKSGYPQSDLIPAEPLTTYTVSAWGKTQGADGMNTPTVRIVELDADKNWLRQINILVFSRGTNDWEQKNMEFQTGSNTKYIYVYANIWDGYGTFWIDDVEIRSKKSMPSPAPTPNGATIAYMGDAEPGDFGKSGITELTKDFNQILPQSPTGKVDAIIMLGDMSKISQVRKAYSSSTAKNIPVFHVIGNHEVENSEDMAAVRSAYGSSLVPLNPGPEGTDKTTYSFNAGNFHIVNMNLYWDGKKNDAWFKYGDGGGYVPDALYNWVDTDLARTSQPWKIVVGHEPLFPLGHHVGNSLDQNVENRDKLENLFISRKVAVYLSGHTHTSAVQLKGGVYHVAAGVTGPGTKKGEDSFASLIYTHTNKANDLIITWRREDPTWATPKTKVYTIDNEETKGAIGRSI